MRSRRQDLADLRFQLRYGRSFADSRMRTAGVLVRFEPSSRSSASSLRSTRSLELSRSEILSEISVNVEHLHSESQTRHLGDGLSKRHGSTIPRLRERFNLLRPGRRLDRESRYRADANRFPEPVAKRDRREMGGERTPRTAGPRDRPEREPTSTPSARVRRVLQRRPYPHEAARFADRPSCPVPTLVEYRGHWHLEGRRPSSSLRVAGRRLINATFRTVDPTRVRPDE